jgi:hypothetical protein
MLNGAMVPEPAASVTVAVHVAAWPARTGLLQVIVVDVVRGLAVKPVVPVLIECVPSP